MTGIDTVRHTDGVNLFDVLALLALPAIVGVLYAVGRIVPKLSRRTSILVGAMLVALLVGGTAYHFGGCDFRSKFCVLSIPNTRSEVGCQWESWGCYVSTYGATN